MASNELWSHWSWPLITAIVGIIFALSIFKQYLDRRKPQQLAWAFGMFLYAVAAALEAYSEFFGAWQAPVYRIYIVMAAALTGWLGLGTLYLIARRRLWGHLFLAYLVVMAALFVFGVQTADLDNSKLIAGITVGGGPLGPSGTFPRLYSLFFNIPGTILLLGGAIYSIILFSLKREYVYRVRANVLIALGTLVIAAAGSKARLGTSTGLYPAEMVGSALLFWGFIVANTLEKGARSIRNRQR